MSLPIYVDGYSGWKANERPLGFELDGVYHRIYAVEDQWYSPDGQYFKVRADGKTYLLRYNEREDEWSLESAFDGAGLFGLDPILNSSQLASMPLGKPSVR